MTANPFVGHRLRNPRVTAAAAETIARDAFGVEGAATELGSHQEQNFRIDATSGSFVLKIANTAFDDDELDLQNRAMAHVAARLAEQVPVAIGALDGRDVVDVDDDGTELRARLVPFLEGTPLREFGYLAPSVLRTFGSLAGRVAAALADFEHPAARRSLQWNLRAAADVVAALAPGVRDPERRAAVEGAMERVTESLDVLAPNLREQVIHGDVIDWNVLARRDASGRPEPVALIDFGDVSRSWRVAECAVAASAATEHSPRTPLQAAREVVRSFHAVAPFEEAEVAALPALLVARAAVSAVSCEQQAVLEPDNVYAVDGLRSGWTRFDAIAAVPLALAEAVFREACALPLRRPRRAPRASAPLVPGLDRTRFVDLSALGDTFAFGSWRDPRVVAGALAHDRTLAIGRHFERRLVHDHGPQHDEPATVHLGVDVFVEAKAPVSAPLHATVTRVYTSTLVLDLADGFRLRLHGIEPAVVVGARVEPGMTLGAVAEPHGGVLPAHLHVELVDGDLDPPGLVPASLAAAWAALAVDPAPLLGLEPAVGEGDETLARRRRFVAPSQVLYYPDDPPRIERGWRQWLYDAHGRPYLDVINNVAVVGHSHPRVEAAAARQLRLLNTNTRFVYDAMGRFAERLAGLLPDPLGVVYLVNSGSEANDLALRIAREVTGHEDVACLEHSYHGWTGATNELLEGDTPRVLRLPKPDQYRDAPAQEAVAAIEARRRLAAFICEPYLGNSGGVELPDGYLQAVYGATRRAGGVCIADEVQVGYGRLGRYFWAFEQQGVVPDVVTIAKATGNGHPVAAVITTRKIADAFQRRADVFSSVGGTPVSCEVALAVLDVIEEEALQENARVVGEYVTERLGPLVGAHPNIGALHGIGLYRGIEVVRDGAPAPLVAHAICERLLSLGVVDQPTGRHGNILKLKPPLCVRRDDVDFFASALELAVREGW